MKLRILSTVLFLIGLFLIPQAAFSESSCEEVASRIQQDAQVMGPYDMQIKRSGAKVALSGEVATEEDKWRMEQLAAQHEDVSRVDNNLQVNPPTGLARYQGTEQVSDTELQSRVSEAFSMSEAGFDGYTIQAQDGKVSLSGDAASFREVDAALAAALNVPGVRDVESEITVKGHSYPVDYFINQ